MKQDPKPLNTGSVTQEVLTDSGPHHLSPYCSGTRRGPYASTRFALCSSPTPSLPSSIWRASSPRNRPPPPDCLGWFVPLSCSLFGPAWSQLCLIIFPTALEVLGAGLCLGPLW